MVSLFNSRKVVDSILDNYVIHGATSASVMIQTNKKTEYYACTNTVWQDFCATSKERDNCHLLKKAIELTALRKSFMINWNLVVPHNDASIYLNEQRQKYDRCNGISFCRFLPGDTLFTLMLTATRKNINFAYLALDNISSIQQDIMYLINLYNR